MTDVGQQILTSLDFNSLYQASEKIIRKLKGKTGYKIGSVLVTAAGAPAVVAMTGTNVFLDLKFDDISNTVGDAVKSAATHRVKMLNVHCSGGSKMLKEAKRAADEVFVKTGNYRPLIIGVTVLTSMDEGDLQETGVDPSLSVADLVAKRTRMAIECGLDGVVCSPWEAPLVRKMSCDGSFIIITPAIRRKGDPVDDQKRSATIREARDMGADYFVIGRPIIKDEDPEAVVDEFIAELS